MIFSLSLSLNFFFVEIPQATLQTTLPPTTTTMRIVTTTAAHPNMIGKHFFSLFLVLFALLCDDIKNCEELSDSFSVDFRT